MDAEERRSTIFRSAAEEFVLVLARAPQSLHASLAQSKQTRAREGAREGELALLAFERGERDGVVESHPVRAEGRESLEFREPRRREIFQLDARRLERGALLGGHRAVGSVRILGRGARARAREPHREGAAQRRLDVSPLAPLEVEERSHHVHRRAIQRGTLAHSSSPGPLGATSRGAARRSFTIAAAESMIVSSSVSVGSVALAGASYPSKETPSARKRA